MRLPLGPRCCLRRTSGAPAAHRQHTSGAPAAQAAQADAAPLMAVFACKLCKLDMGRLFPGQPSLARQHPETATETATETQRERPRLSSPSGGRWERWAVGHQAAQLA
mmetsp:Transcript_65457/g.129622  ORF Transcript_65457/g.129622 Transcript_65457/m.129622 type:complete len:108 (-) Transcript_65457:560-883(-)